MREKPKDYRDIVTAAITLAEIANLTPDMLKDRYSAEEIAELDAQVNRLLLIERAKIFCEDGFTAYFEFMSGGPLHREGVVWVRNLFIALANKQRKLLQKAFRGSGKTTVISLYFASYFIGHFPHKTHGIIRINDAKAAETAGAIADLIDKSSRWKEVFPNVVPDKERGWGEVKGYYLVRSDVDKDKWEEIQTDTHRPTGPTFIGYGYQAGGVIGSRWNGLALVDDIHNRENTRNSRQLAEVRQWVTDTFLPIPVPKETFEVWNYTPWLPNDAYAFREATGKYIQNESPVMRMAKEGDEGAEYWELDPDIPISGAWYVLSWPERWGFDEIGEKYIDMMQENAADFARMYMLDLEVIKGLNLKMEWLHRYPSEQIDNSWPVIFGIDYASTADKIKNKGRDFFAIAVLRVIPGGGMVLVDGVRKHLSKGEALALVVAMVGMYPTTQKIGVENIGKGEEFYNDLVFMDDAAGRVLPLIPISHGKKSKGDRFENWLAPRFKMTRLWVSNIANDFINHFQDEWMLWPGTKFDDCLDAVYMAAAVGEEYMPGKAERSLRKKKNNSGQEILRALASA